MQKPILFAIALSLVACEDEKTEAPAAAPAEEVAVAADVEGLKASLATIVAAVRTEDLEARRAACLTAVPKLDEARAAAPDDKGVQAVETDLLPLCVEMVETKKLLAKLAKPAPTIELSAAYAQAFTHADLAKTFKKAKRLAKRKQDPAAACTEVRALTDHLGSKKRKKTRRLVAKAKKFCDGYAHLASARFHLRVADAAVAEGSTNTLVESCVHGVAELSASPAGKLHTKLEEKAKVRCVEAVALQGALRGDAT